MTIEAYIAMKIKQFRIERNLSQDDIAAIAQTSRVSVTRWENNTRVISYKKLKLLLDFYEKNFDQFFEDYRIFSLKERQKNEANEVTTSAVISTFETLEIDCWGSISAGIFETAAESMQKIACPLHLQRYGTDNLFALTVSGDSMNKVIEDGETGFFLKQSTVKNGEVAAVILNGTDATLKRFFQNDTQTITLLPDSYDPRFTPQVIDLQENTLQIIGKLVFPRG